MFYACEEKEPEPENTVENTDIPITDITLSADSITLTVGEQYSLTATIIPSNTTEDKTLFWMSENECKASVNKNGTITALVEGSTSIGVYKAGNRWESASCVVTIKNNPLFAVDEGVVINGIKWATRNVGAPGVFAGKPEDAGMFYQFNSRVGWSSTDPLTKTDHQNTMTREWRKKNDPSPAGWRVPTFAELESLQDETKVSNEWVTIGNVAGKRFTDKTTGNSIFIPSVGSRYFNNGQLSATTISLASANYWSGTSTKLTGIAYRWGFNKAVEFYQPYESMRSYAYPIRSVAE